MVFESRIVRQSYTHVSSSVKFRSLSSSTSTCTSSSTSATSIPSLSQFQLAVLPTVQNEEGIIKSTSSSKLDLDILLSLCRKASNDFILSIASNGEINVNSSQHSRLHGSFLMLFDRIWSEAVTLRPDLIEINLSTTITSTPALTPAFIALCSVSREASFLSIKLGCAPDSKTHERLIRIAGLQSSSAARAAFNTIGFAGSVPTNDAYHALLLSFARHGDPINALPVLFTMKQLGIRPDSTILSTLLTQADAVLAAADEEAGQGIFSGTVDSLSSQQQHQSNIYQLHSLRLLQAVAISTAEDELQEAVNEMELSQLHQSTIHSQQLESDEQNEESTTIAENEKYDEDVIEKIQESESTTISEDDTIPPQLEKEAEQWRKAVHEILQSNGSEPISAEVIRDTLLKSKQSTYTEGEIELVEKQLRDNSQKFIEVLEDTSSSSSSSSSSTTSTLSHFSPIENTWSDVVEWRDQALAHSEAMRERSSKRLASFLSIAEEILNRNHKSDSSIDPRLVFASNKAKNDLSFRNEILTSLTGRLQSALLHIIPSRVRIIASTQNILKDESEEMKKTETASLVSKENGVLSPLLRSQIISSLVHYCLDEERKQRQVELNTSSSKL
jgi:hypothetical protein